jgi:uncharacterized FlgJ-related protein
LDDGGQTKSVPLFFGVKPGTRGVTLDDLREKSYSLGLQRASEPPSDAPETERIKWVGARKKAFQRAVEKLQETRKVRVEEEWVWTL